jgi:hypothetical protein
MDDILRAEYLLRTEHQVTAFEEGKGEQNPKLAAWVFMTREEIDESETTDELMCI